MYFLILIILIILCNTTFIKTSKQFKGYLYIVLFVLLFFLIALRDNIGTDYGAYVNIYNYYNSNFNQNVPREEAFKMINFLSKNLFDNYYVMFAIMGFISMLFLFIGVANYTNYIFISLGIYFVRFYFLRDFNQIRQGVACTIILYSTLFLSDKNKKKYFLYVIIATLFHRVALIGFVAYFFNLYIKESRRKIYVMLLFSIFISLLPMQKIIYLLSFNLIDPAYFFDEINAFTLGLFNPTTLMQFFILVVFVNLENALKNRQKNYYVLRNLYTLSTLILVSLNQLAVIAGRVSTVYATLEIIIIPSFIYCFKNKIIVSLLIFLYIIVMFYINVYLRLGADYWPYRSILEF